MFIYLQFFFSFLFLCYFYINIFTSGKKTAEYTLIFLFLDRQREKKREVKRETERDMQKYLVFGGNCHLQIYSINSSLCMNIVFTNYLNEENQSKKRYMDIFLYLFFTFHKQQKYKEILIFLLMFLILKFTIFISLDL